MFGVNLLGVKTGIYEPEGTKDIFYTLSKDTKYPKSLHSLAISAKEVMSKNKGNYEEWHNKTNKLVREMHNKGVFRTNVQLATVEDVITSFLDSPLELNEEFNKRFGGLGALILYTQRVPGHMMNSHSVFSKLNYDYLKNTYATFLELDTQNKKEKIKNLEDRILSDIFGNGAQKKFNLQDPLVNESVFTSIEYVSEKFGDYLGIKNFDLYEKQFRQALIDATVVWFDEVNENIKVLEGNIDKNKTKYSDKDLGFVYTESIKKLKNKIFRDNIYKKYYNITLENVKKTSLFDGFYSSVVENLVDMPLFGLKFFEILQDWKEKRGSPLDLNELKGILRGGYAGKVMDEFPGKRVKVKTFKGTKCGGGGCYPLNTKKLKELVEKSTLNWLYYSYNNLFKSKKKDDRYFMTKRNFIEDIKNNNFDNIRKKLKRKKDEIIKKNGFYEKEKTQTIDDFLEIMDNSLCNKWSEKKNKREIIKYKSKLDIVIDEEVRKILRSFELNEHSKKELNKLYENGILTLPANKSKKPHKPKFSVDSNQTSVYIREEKGCGVCDDAFMVNMGIFYGVTAMAGVVLEDAIDTIEKSSFVFNSHGKDETIGDRIFRDNLWLKKELDEETLKTLVAFSVGRLNLEEEIKETETSEGFIQIRNYEVSKINGHCSERHLNLSKDNENIGGGKNPLTNHLTFVLSASRNLIEYGGLNKRYIANKVLKDVDRDMKIAFSRMNYERFVEEIFRRVDKYDYQTKFFEKSINNWKELLSNERKIREYALLEEKLREIIHGNKKNKNYRIFIPLSFFNLRLSKEVQKTLEEKTSINLNKSQLSISKLKEEKEE